MNSAMFKPDGKPPIDGVAAVPVNGKQGPKVDLEKVTFYEMDTAADADNHPLTPEEDAHNDKFLQDNLIPELTRRVKVCECRIPEVMNRNVKRAQLMGIDPRTAPLMMDQSDIDACKFGVIVTSKNGVYTGIACIIVECAKCRKIDIYGDASNLATLIANNLVHTYREEGDDEVTETITEDELFGEGMVLSDIDGAAEGEDHCECHCTNCEDCWCEIIADESEEASEEPKE